jgi:hypothetical protein
LIPLSSVPLHLTVKAGLVWPDERRVIETSGAVLSLMNLSRIAAHSSGRVPS